VTDAVVTLDRTAAGEDVLAAWVVCDRRDAGMVPGLRRELARFLPRHLVPERVTLLDRLPRTASGKLDRNALTPPAPTPSGAAAGPADPRAHDRSVEVPAPGPPG
jgi:acyl-coenzyme A synthetase/AMP-(fatty) acid ligase